MHQRVGSGKLRSASPVEGVSDPAQSNSPVESALRPLEVPPAYPPDGFTDSLTLSSKCFSTFPHGTCSLSVSPLYPSPASDGVYHRLKATLSSSPTLGSERERSTVSPMPEPPLMALHQLRMTAFKRTSGRSASVPRRRRPPPERHMPADPLGSRVRRLAFPFSLAVTGGIPFGFLFLRSMICLSSAGALARFQVETVVFSSERPSCLGLATRPYEIHPGWYRRARRLNAVANDRIPREEVNGRTRSNDPMPRRARTVCCRVEVPPEVSLERLNPPC